jgi:hypothetical protein
MTVSGGRSPTYGRMSPCRHISRKHRTVEPGATGCWSRGVHFTASHGGIGNAECDGVAVLSSAQVPITQETSLFAEPTLRCLFPLQNNRITL